MKLVSSNFLQTIDDVFFSLPFACGEDMNKAHADAKVTEKDMASFTGRLNADHDKKNARAHLHSGLEWKRWHYACIVEVERCLFA